LMCKRSNCCEDNAYVACASPPCADYVELPQRTSLPSGIGCQSLDRQSCCLHFDGRSGTAYGGQLCSPATDGENFTSGNTCEPFCWAKGTCGSGKDQKDRVGVCSASSRGSCPADYPFAYRPVDGFDYCCASANDDNGHIGINANAARCGRADTCETGKYTACLNPPCSDYSGPQPANATAWLETWADMRCGKVSQYARQAWLLLGETVYKHDSAQDYEHHVAYCPTTMPQGSGWDRQRGAERPSWYASSTLHEAWGLLIRAADECHISSAFKFDLVDVGREYLSIAPCNTAYDDLLVAKTPAAVRQANASFSDFMVDLDRLLGSSNGFLLGRWVQDARTMAAAAGANYDQDFLEWNARSQVTSWYPSNACGMSAQRLDDLWDYGNKAWSGLVHGYYDRRMQIYAEQKLSQFEMGELEMDASAFTGAVMKFACEFQHSTDELPAIPHGDAVTLAEELWMKYAPAGLPSLHV